MRVTRCFLEPPKFGASVEVVVRTSTDLPLEAFFLSHVDRFWVKRIEKVKVNINVNEKGKGKGKG
jgi:hypothetical protein